MNTLSLQKTKALQALLTCPTRNEAAAKAGITPKTLRNWLNHDSEFKAAYLRATDELLAEASLQAKVTVSPALDTLRGIMQDTDAPAAARVTAARAVLDYSLKLQESAEFAQRLSDLENQNGVW